MLAYNVYETIKLVITNNIKQGYQSDGLGDWFTYSLFKVILPNTGFWFTRESLDSFEYRIEAGDRRALYRPMLNMNKTLRSSADTHFVQCLRKATAVPLV